MEDDRIDRVGTDIQEKATVIWNVANAIFGIFKPHEYGKVILPMTVIKRFHDCLAASARSSNMKVFMDTIFKDIFEHAAMDCYVKSMEGFENLMQDDDKRTRLRELLAQAFYRRFRTAYTLPDEEVQRAAVGEA